MANKTALAVLLGADRGKLKLLPTKQVEITRLSERTGEPVVFTVRALLGDELQECQEAAKKPSKNGDDEEQDGHLLQIMVLLSACKDPNLRDKALLELYDVATPEQLFDGTFLLPGERYQLFTAIQELSGFGENAVAEIKN